MIEIVPYRSEWADEFEREAASLLDRLTGRVDLIEHIGSTAVPDLEAKPIIDLAARTLPGVDPFDLESSIAELGYEQHRSGPRTHGVYVRHTAATRTHILHAFTTGEWETCNQRLFRDKLLHEASARERYRAVKLEASAAAQTGQDYTRRKTAIVEELLNEERASRGLPPTAAWDKTDR
ncbi:GrpB-like predicted nucleotidyltransferase (UPF0157 family) [Labedella gwakjiensis]|nr:GrpB family protein [Labedella gwakjiensis]PSL38256.1 GrpB-like predicted nucleotidyltransferase (UPF0157 family) [Labedella gwakjiensis]